MRNCEINKEIKKKYKLLKKLLTILNIVGILSLVQRSYGRLAQLVRAPALQAGGHRFESYIAHHAEIAQLVEQLTCNQ